jgi:hypothetical protein
MTWDTTKHYFEEDNETIFSLETEGNPLKPTFIINPFEWYVSEIEGVPPLFPPKEMHSSGQVELALRAVSKEPLPTTSYLPTTYLLPTYLLPTT